MYQEREQIPRTPERDQIPLCPETKPKISKNTSILKSTQSSKKSKPIIVTKESAQPV
jgi:carbohydrate-binding DOMON domain-containing protein